jgi:hypothetical protein
MKRFLVLFTLAFACSGMGLLQASSIVLNSQAGLGLVCTWNDAGDICTPTATGTTVAITPHPVWQGNNPVNPGAPDNSAVWISYAKTGHGEAVLAPFRADVPVWSLTQQISGTWLNLHVWADDTAGVYLNDIALIAPTLGQSPPCSGAPIGCVAGHVGVINMALAPGLHTLRFDVFQTGTGTTTLANPHGLLFTGAVTTVPEGGMTLMLLGGALLGLETFRRRFRV